MANLLDNELFKNAVADVMALKEGAEAAALNVLAKKNEKILQETVKSLMEADDLDEKDTDTDDEDTDETGPDSSSDAPVGDATGSDAGAGEDTTAPTSTDEAVPSTGDETSGTDGMPEDGDSGEGETIQLDPKKFAQALGDAVSQAVKSAVEAAANGESQIDSGDLEGGENDGGIPFESPDGGEGEGDDYSDGDFDSDDDIMIVPDGSEGGESEGNEEGEEHNDAPQGNGGNTFIIQDEGEDGQEQGEGPDFDTSKDHLREELEKTKEQLDESNNFAKSLVEELRSIRLFQQKTEYLKTIIAENFNQFDSVTNPTIIKSIENARDIILENFDNADTLQAAENVYHKMNKTAKHFAGLVKAQLLGEGLTAKNPEKPVIAEGATKGKKNFNLETAKRTVLKESANAKTTSSTGTAKQGLLESAVATRTPTDEETSNFWSGLRKFY